MVWLLGASRALRASPIDSMMDFFMSSSSLVKVDLRAVRSARETPLPPFPPAAAAPAATAPCPSCCTTTAGGCWFPDPSPELEPPGTGFCAGSGLALALTWAPLACFLLEVRVGCSPFAAPPPRPPRALESCTIIKATLKTTSDRQEVLTSEKVKGSHFWEVYRELLPTRAFVHRAHDPWESCRTDEGSVS